MNISFQITDVPNSKRENDLISYLEGSITILVDDILFFHQPAIPLIELAISIKRWLGKISSGKEADFIYESMDNERPLLSFRLQENGRYKISSVWGETDIDRLLSKQEIVSPFQTYLDELDRSLKKGLDVELKDFY